MRTRNWPLLAALFALVAGATSTALADGKSDVALAPQDTMALLHVDLRALRGTSLFQDILKQIKTRPDAQQGLAEVKKTFGFDPETDLHGVTVILSDKFSENEQMAVVVEADVEPKTVAAALEKEGKGKLTRTQHEGTEVLGGPGGEGLAFTAGKRAVMGPKPMVERALSASKGKGALAKDGALRKLVDGVDTSKHVWFAASLPANVRQQMGPQGKDLESVSGSIDLSRGIGLRLNIGTASAEAAKAIVTQVQAGVQDPQAQPMLTMLGIAPALQAMKTVAKGKVVSVALDLTQDQVMKLKAMAGMMMMGGGMGGPPGAPPPGARTLPPPQK